MVALENTLNGTIIPQTEVVAISTYVHSVGAKMHLDGARIWHVAAETNTSIKELCDPFDSVSLCFSKGLGMVLLQSIEVLSNLISRCAYRIYARGPKGLYQEGAVAPKALWRWHAPNWLPRCFCGVCTHPQLPPTTPCACPRQKGGSGSRGDRRHYLEQSGDLYG